MINASSRLPNAQSFLSHFAFYSQILAQFISEITTLHLLKSQLA